MDFYANTASEGPGCLVRRSQRVWAAQLVRARVDVLGGVGQAPSASPSASA